MRLMQANLASVLNVAGVVAHPTKKLNPMRGKGAIRSSRVCSECFAWTTSCRKTIRSARSIRSSSKRMLFARICARARAPWGKFVRRRRDRWAKMENCYQATKKEHPQSTGVQNAKTKPRNKNRSNECRLFCCQCFSSMLKID